MSRNHGAGSLGGLVSRTGTETDWRYGGLAADVLWQPSLVKPLREFAPLRPLKAQSPQPRFSPLTGTGHRDIVPAGALTSSSSLSIAHSTCRNWIYLTNPSRVLTTTLFGLGRFSWDDMLMPLGGG